MKHLENATIMWNEQEIELRESLVREIYLLIKNAWTKLNPAVSFERVETPCLVSANMLTTHAAEGFPLMAIEWTNRVLRPETTAGTVDAFERMYPMANQRAKRMPICLWQAGKSFRDEENKDSMRSSKLRLREFYQLEFQLFVQNGTKANYLERALLALIDRYGGEFRTLDPNDTPHYSEITRDWEIDGIEISSCSIRTDYSGCEIHEVSIGLDRLVNSILGTQND